MLISDKGTVSHQSDIGQTIYQQHWIGHVEVDKP